MNKRDSMINFCLNQANLSKCEDAQVAAILLKSDMKQIYSIGINGGPTHGKQCLCKNSLLKESKYTCAHAEMNCLVKNKEISDIPKIMICSKKPCVICATLIINSETNIEEVWYIEEYWDNSGPDLLKNANIKVKQLIEYEIGKWCFADEVQSH